RVCGLRVGLQWIQAHLLIWIRLHVRVHDARNRCGRRLCCLTHSRDSKFDRRQWRGDEVVLVVSHNVRAFTTENADDLQTHATEANLFSDRRFVFEQLLRNSLANHANRCDGAYILPSDPVAFSDWPVPDNEVVRCDSKNPIWPPVFISV